MKVVVVFILKFQVWFFVFVLRGVVVVVFLMDD